MQENGEFVDLGSIWPGEPRNLRCGMRGQVLESREDHTLDLVDPYQEVERGCVVWLKALEEWSDQLPPFLDGPHSGEREEDYSGQAK